MQVAFICVVLLVLQAYLKLVYSKYVRREDDITLYDCNRNKSESHDFINVCSKMYNEMHVKGIDYNGNDTLYEENNEDVSTIHSYIN